MSSKATRTCCLSPHLKNMTEDTTTATRFMVLPTEKVTGEMPWSNTMYESCSGGRVGG